MVGSVEIDCGGVNKPISQSESPREMENKRDLARDWEVDLHFWSGGSIPDLSWKRRRKYLNASMPWCISKQWYKSP